MKAIIYENYGGPEVLKLVEVPTPIPSSNEILIKVMAASVTTADWRLRSLSMPYGFKFIARLIFGFKKPRQKILGTELSGIVVGVGKNVGKFKIGDQLIAQVGAKMGAYVEYRCLNENEVIVKKPAFLSFAEAATISFGFTTAWAFLVTKANLQPRQTILINGASGSIGSAAIQIAKHLGTTVTAVCSGQNRDLVKKLGADFVIDYNTKDFKVDGIHYDYILDSVGNLSFAQIKNSLNEKGKFLLVSGDLPQLLTAPLVNLSGRKKIIAAPVPENLHTLQTIVNLFAEKKLVPVVDQVFSMEEISKAHAYVDKRHRKGNVAIEISK